jgi:hypothetical protein
MLPVVINSSGICIYLFNSARRVYKSYLLISFYSSLGFILSNYLRSSFTSYSSSPNLNLLLMNCLVIQLRYVLLIVGSACYNLLMISITAGYSSLVNNYNLSEYRSRIDLSLLGDILDIFNTE